MFQGSLGAPLQRLQIATEREDHQVFAIEGAGPQQMATKKCRTLRAKHWLSHTIALPEMHMFVFPQGLRLEVLWAFPPRRKEAIRLQKTSFAQP